MKKLILLASFSTILLQGCGESTPPVPEPDQFAISYLEAVMGSDFETVYDQLSKEDQAYISKMDYVEFKFPSDGFFGEMRDEMVSMRKSLITQTTYTIEEKDINESRANIVVSISAPDYTKFMGEIFTQALSQAFNGEDLNDNNQLLGGLADKQDVPRNIIKQELELRLEDGQWRVFENVKAAYKKAETTKKIGELLKKASNFREKKKFTESLNTYKEVLDIDESNSKAKQAINKIGDEIEEAEFKQAYIENIEIFEFEAKRIDSFLKGKNIPAVRFALKNNGDRSLDKVEVTVYFYDNNNQPIYEKTFTPVLVSKYSFSNDGPLKPNYIWRGETNNYYTIEQLGSEWSGKAKATISDIRFSE